MFHLNPKVSIEVCLYYSHAIPFPYTVTEDIVSRSDRGDRRIPLVFDPMHF